MSSEALNLPISSTLSVPNLLANTLGSASNPAYYFSNSINTGMYAISSPPTLGFAVSGTPVLTAESNMINFYQPLQLPDVTAPTPTSATEGYIYKKSGSNKLYWRTLNSGEIDLTAIGVSYPLQATDGSISAPSYSWTNAPLTGIYLSTTDTMRFTSASTDVLQINATGSTCYKSLDLSNQNISNINTLTCITTNISDLNISSNTITTTVTDSDISLIPTGTGNVVLNGQSSLTNHAITKQYVDNLAHGLDMKDAVDSATTANVNLAAGGDIEDGKTLEGVVLTTGMRVLIKNQTIGSENGIYDVQAAGVAPTRSADFPAGTNTVSKGSFTLVISGNLDGTSWVLNNADPIDVGTDALTFIQFSTNVGDNLGNHTAS